MNQPKHLFEQPTVSSEVDHVTSDLIVSYSERTVVSTARQKRSKLVLHDR